MRNLLRFKMFSILTLVIIVLVVLGATIISYAQELSLTFDGTTQSTIYNALKIFSDEVNEKTGGKVSIKIIPQCATSGGDILAAIEQTQAGALDAIIIPTGLYQNWAPEWGLLCLPFLAKNLEETYKIYNSKIGERLLETFEKNDLKGIDIWVRNARQLLTTSKPVRVPSDLKGLKIRVPENAVYIATFKQLGAIPVPTPWGEVYNALKLRVVDGMETPTAYIVSQKFYEVIKYVTFWDYSSEGMALVFNKEAWNKLPESTKIIIEKAAKNAGCIKLQLDSQATEEVIRKLKEEKVESIILTDEQYNKFVEAMMPVWDEFREKIGASLIDETKEFMANTK